MIVTRQTYQVAMLNKGCSRIYWLKNVQGNTILLCSLTNHLKSWILLGFIISKTCRIAAHLEALEFDVSLVATEWFLCVFSKSLPSEVKLLYHNMHIPLGRETKSHTHTRQLLPVSGLFLLKKIVFTCLDNLAGVGCPFLWGCKGSFPCSSCYFQGKSFSPKSSRKAFIP